MVRKCPHCQKKVGMAATKCWNCKQELDGSASSSLSTPHKTKRGSGKKRLLIPVIIIVLVLVFVSIAYILMSSEKKEIGIEIKIFYDGAWEGTVMFYDTSDEMDAKVESGDYEDEVSGSGNDVFKYTGSNKKYLSASFTVTDSNPNPIKVEVWVNGKLAVGTREGYNLPTYTCTVNLDQFD